MRKAVKRDISDRPSDLPLMQVALREAWRAHRAAGIGLIEAYESVGGVLGALANEAEAARCRLTPEDQARLESIFVRLVRLGDTGGATRRTAALDEFVEARRGLVQRLGKDEFGRLVVVGEAERERDERAFRVARRAAAFHDVRGFAAVQPRRVPHRHGVR